MNKTKIELFISYSSLILHPLSLKLLAERVGFEPTVPVKAQQFSRLPDSTTLAPLRTSEFTILMVRDEKFQVGLSIKLLDF